MDAAAGGSSTPAVPSHGGSGLAGPPAADAGGGSAAAAAITYDLEETLEQQLLRAAAAGDLAEVGRLVELEAELQWQEPAEGVSALMRAAEGGHARVAELLLENGAPWNAQDKAGYTAGAVRA